MTNKLLNSYQEINLNNYDDADLRNLRDWADMAYDRMHFLEGRLEAANRILTVMTDVMGEW